jgi:hypothetical protein
LNQLVTVKFYGDELDAVQDGDRRVWVSLLRCSGNLGVDAATQARKLKDKPWATTSEMTVVAEDGKQRSLTMIDLDTLPGWLFSIDARKVKPEVRDKLVKYQREAAKALADHFFKRTPAIDIEMVRQLARQVIAEDRAAGKLPSLPAPGSSPAVPRTSVAERVRDLGWLNTTALDGALARLPETQRSFFVAGLMQRVGSALNEGDYGPSPSGAWMFSVELTGVLAWSHDIHTRLKATGAADGIYEPGYPVRAGIVLHYTRKAATMTEAVSKVLEQVRAAGFEARRRL